MLAILNGQATQHIEQQSHVTWMALCAMFWRSYNFFFFAPVLSLDLNYSQNFDAHFLCPSSHQAHQGISPY